MRGYNKANIPLAKDLRKNMTPWEQKLWYEFLRSYPVRFQRQKALGNYIADFYCAKARLIVELDGGRHYKEEQFEKDAIRTKALESMNLTVLQICNLDIDRNFRGICEHIDLTVKNSPSVSFADSSLARGSLGYCYAEVSSKNPVCELFTDRIYCFMTIPL